MKKGSWLNKLGPDKPHTRISFCLIYPELGAKKPIWKCQCVQTKHTHTHTHTHTKKGLFFSSQRMRKRAIMQDRDLLDNNCYTPTMHHKKAAIPSHLCQQGLHKEPRFLLSPAIMRSSFPPAGMLSEIAMWSWDFHSYPEVMSLLPPMRCPWH